METFQNILVFFYIILAISSSAFWSLMARGTMDGEGAEFYDSLCVIAVFGEFILIVTFFICLFDSGLLVLISDNKAIIILITTLLARIYTLAYKMSDIRKKD